MPLSRFEFEFMTYFYEKGFCDYSYKNLSDELTVSMKKVDEIMNGLIKEKLVNVENNKIFITDHGFEVLEEYRVRKAIIFAAGFGSRMVPVTLDRPKPLVKVNGVRIIDTLIDSLISKGIFDITIVRGYKKEKFEELKTKYPFIKYIDNDDYDKGNNITSAIKVVDLIDRCYICDSDLLISNPEIIKKYQYTSNYLGAKVRETDDWCYCEKDGYIDGYTQGGENCYQMFGISFWDEEDSKKLANDIVEVYNSENGKNRFWDDIALDIKKDRYKLEIRPCLKSDIIEIDNFYELVELDPSYKDYKSN